MVDQSNLRRGIKSANLIWGNEASVLAGDFLFAQSFDLMVETKSLNALSVLAQASYCLLYTSPSPRDRTRSRMPSSA